MSCPDGASPWSEVKSGGFVDCVCRGGGAVFQEGQDPSAHHFHLILAKFGANAILGVSLAVCKAGAVEKGVPLYRHIADLAGNPEVILPVPVSGILGLAKSCFLYVAALKYPRKK